MLIWLSFLQVHEVRDNTRHFFELQGPLQREWSEVAFFCCSDWFCMLQWGVQHPFAFHVGHVQFPDRGHFADTFQILKLTWNHLVCKPWKYLFVVNKDLSRGLGICFKSTLFVHKWIYLDVNLVASDSLIGASMLRLEWNQVCLVIHIS